MGYIFILTWRDSQYYYINIETMKTVGVKYNLGISKFDLELKDEWNVKSLIPIFKCIIKVILMVYHVSLIKY